MKKETKPTITIRCPDGVRAVGDLFLAGKEYTLPVDEAQKFIDSGKMIPVAGE